MATENFMQLSKGFRPQISPVLQPVPIPRAFAPSKPYNDLLLRNAFRELFICLSSCFAFGLCSQPASRLLPHSRSTLQNSRSSPRPISIGQLNTLLHLHLRPINHVVYMGSYPFLVRYLIFGRVSRLDAFSVYLIRTWLPSRAIGMTTGAPEVRPSRSSRTKDSSHQISCAHDR